MASSLDKLASYIDEYPIVSSTFPNLSKEKIQLLTRKGVFPYEYLDSREKLRHSYHRKKNSLALCMTLQFLTKAMNVHNGYGLSRSVKILAIMCTCT